ncbi:MAG: hypothetical protein MJE77_03405 [Proteobacteria bacterium]|nr:hypothetical protein [Pseudomonadota bacterium]
MTTRFLIPTSAALFFGLSALAGCPGDNDALTQDDYDDVAVAVGSLVANPSGGESGSIDDSINLVKGTASASKAVEGESAHETYRRAGLTYEYVVDCVDAAGNVQSACDRATTGAASIAVNWTGNLDLPAYQALVTRTGEWTLAGLQSATAELSGAGSFDVECHFQALYRPVMKDLVLSYNAQYQAVAIDMATGRITGGTIRYQIDGQRSVRRGESDRDSEFSTVAEVTFDGSGSARLILDSSRSYTIDLATGQVDEAE